MKLLGQKSEFVASTLILVSSVFASEFLIHKYVFSAPTAPAPISRSEPQSPLHSQIVLPNVNWTDRPKTLVLALQASCGYCNRSAPFYQRLLASIGDKNTRVIAVLPGELSQNRVHLDNLGLKNLELRSASLESLQVEGTPTLLLVNDKGEVTDFWVGKLSPDKESEVISKLTS